ncbi:hypothetical protein ARMSODRAFT_1018770 [Armillaria solidipes]|uniref:Uncharacterized protein n=1 Tax=Armillaria solidipes TaxID=1076256 RepID=A0A2H3BZL8_9AGAR|nr:hypothetical protein ARMSODRAFT_1018770 [Armillaria solidipes]
MTISFHNVTVCADERGARKDEKEGTSPLLSLKNQCIPPGCLPTEHAQFVDKSMSLWLLSGLIRTRSTAEALERLQDGYVSEEYVALNDMCEWDPYSRSSLAQARELVTIVGGVRHSIQSGYLVPLEQYMCPAEERIWGRIYR